MVADGDGRVGFAMRSTDGNDDDGRLPRTLEVRQLMTPIVQMQIVPVNAAMWVISGGFEHDKDPMEMDVWRAGW